MEGFMNRLIKTTLNLALLVGLAISGAAHADAILTVWNVDDIDATGDQVSVVVGTDVDTDGITVTTLRIQWQEADITDSLTTATALDQFYFNSVEGLDLWDIVGVEECIGTVCVDDIARWSFGRGGESAGAAGLFGLFASKNNKEAPANDGGIEPSSILFTFNELVTFQANAKGATYAAHVRYGDSDCSGWVSDPTDTDPDGTSPGTCGGSTSVPEPGMLSLIGLGLLGIGIARRRKALPVS